MRERLGFVKDLMTIANCQSNSADVGLVAVCCLSDNVRQFYQNSSGEVIPEQDKQFLRDNIIESISICCHIKAARDTYIQILERVVALDYPKKWQSLPSTALNNLTSCSTVDDLYASLTAIHSMFKVVSLSLVSQQVPLEELVQGIAPSLQELAMNQLEGFESSGQDFFKIMLPVLKIILAAVKVELPRYFATRKGDGKGTTALSIWMNIIAAIMDKLQSTCNQPCIDSWDAIIKAERELPQRVSKICVQIVSSLCFHARTKKRATDSGSISDDFAHNWSEVFLDKVLTMIS